MRFYKTTTSIRLAAGLAVALTAEQVKSRRHLLTIDEDGTITTREPIEFKAGEIVGFEQEPRGLLPRLEALEFDDDGDDGDGEMFGAGHHASGESDIADVGCADGIDQLKMVVATNLDIDPEVVRDKPAKKSAK